MVTAPRPPDSRLCALVGRLIANGNLDWRHHKIGVLQAYVLEAGAKTEVEYRIHVWHPSLLLADDDSGPMHDHRFELHSSVLLGRMFDEEISLYENGNREPYRIWDIQNARSAALDGEHWVRLGDEKEYGIDAVHHSYAYGSEYSYPARVFHRSRVEELTVTFVTKKNQHLYPGPARLLARLGYEPTHAFSPGPAHGNLPANAAELFQEASERLFQLAHAR